MMFRKISLLLLSGLVLYSIVSCDAHYMAQKTSQAFVLINHFHWVDTITNKVMIDDDSLEVMPVGDLIFFKRFYEEIFENLQFDPATNTEKTLSFKSTRNAKYVVQSGRNATGIIFNSYADSLGKSARIDSILMLYGFKGAQFFDLTQKLFKTENDQTGKVKETYLPDKTVSSKYPDTMIYTYDKRLNHIAYSLAPGRDSTLTGKLVDVKMIFNRKKGVPRRIFEFELKPSAGLGKDEIETIQRKFRSRRQ
ncbi:hypothetical protein [Hufsiella ginkgonis]|uniref:Lipoprotein n=1 Tax=Hufsiella ginkgonis TaxID=2695274 RepID=A0A7K1XYE5_9SPHI|nr:hypothetical protein [Hufsiella ginkgonis]MXV15972.1 hypothetical protein [Hufsiella ginkgonis]